MKLKLISLFILCVNILVAQDKIILGTILNDFSTGVQDCHIINLNTKNGVVSDVNGYFRIKVNLKDVLKISHVEFKTKFIRVSKIKSDVITVKLLSNAIELDEVIVGNKLSGNLTADIKQVPKDTVAILIRRLRAGFENFPKDAIKNMGYGNEETSLTKPTPLSDIQFGASGIPLGNDKYAEVKRALRREIKFKESFPIQLKRELGEKFLFDDLKIPREKYHHFLEYCNPLGIAELYKKGAILKVVHLLQKESVSYLEIIKK